MSQPTQQHEWLQKHVGTWDAAVSGSMGESSGTCTYKAGPGGLWLVSDFDAPIMGMPFQGMEVLGFDPSDSTFNSVWVDSMTTTATLMKGTYDKDTKTLTLRGESVGPDGSKTPMTNVTRYPDADHMVFEMKGPGEDGKPMTYMTIEYTRRK
jgi:hypothetical protein